MPVDDLFSDNKPNNLHFNQRYTQEQLDAYQADLERILELVEDGAVEDGPGDRYPGNSLSEALTGSSLTRRAQ